jgi:hypothetical protein
MCGICPARRRHGARAGGADGRQRAANQVPRVAELRLVGVYGTRLQKSPHLSKCVPVKPVWPMASMVSVKISLISSTVRKEVVMGSAYFLLDRGVVAPPIRC